MKVTLTLEQPVNNYEAFTTMEYVRGGAALHLKHQQAISEIILSLRGELKSTLILGSTRSEDSAWSTGDHHKLFKLTKTLFPPADVALAPNGFNLPKGTHSFPFEIRFPVLSACHKPQPWTTPLKTTLPPSFTFQTPTHRDTAEVQYCLRVKVRRPGRFKRDPASEQELTFLPLDPDLPPPTLNLAYGRSTEPLGVGNPVSCSPPSVFKSTSEVVTRACRSVMVEATLPSPAILYMQNYIPLRLFMKTHAPLADGPPPIELRTPEVVIQTSTTISIGSDSGTWTSSRDIVRLSGLDLLFTGARVGGELSDEISTDLWKDAILSNVTPSFTTCTAMRQHSLVVTAGFSYSPENEVWVAKTAISVEVHSGITPAPGVTVIDDLYGNQSNEQAVLIP